MKKKRVLITGASGLVGQNLVVRLKHREDVELIGIDKHEANNRIFKSIHADVVLIEADLSMDGDWSERFEGVDVVVMNHAQISSLKEQEFYDNNVLATKKVIEACKEHKIPYIVHISSSVVNSLADDHYTRTKSLQEKLVTESDIDAVVLRPTLMFGWFDRKHLGWLSRFMKKTPIFPIPNRGRYMRQPLYVGDFSNVIISTIFNPVRGEVHDISGQEKIHYVDMIKTLRRITRAKTMLVYIPFKAFWGLLKVYSLFDRNPPFTTSQLEALVITEEFPISDWGGRFDVHPTTFDAAVEETHNDEIYSKIVLEF